MNIHKYSSPIEVREYYRNTLNISDPLVAVRKHISIHYPEANTIQNHKLFAELNNLITKSMETL